MELLKIEHFKFIDQIETFNGPTAAEGKEMKANHKK